MDTEYLDRTLLNLVSIGRENNPTRIEKLETMKAQMLDYAARHVNEKVRPMSYLYLAGMDCWDIMKMTGHDSPTNLKKYIKADELQVVETIVNKYNYFD